MFLPQTFAGKAVVLNMALCVVWPGTCIGWYGGGTDICSDLRYNERSVIRHNI